METEETNKKTGATPTVIDGVGGGEVLGVAEIKTVMVKYRDGHGVEATKLAIVVAGGELYFLDDKAIGKQAQTWLKNEVFTRLGLTKEA